MSGSAASNAQRGRPLVTLLLLMVAWIGARAVFWEMPFIEERGLGETLAPLLAQSDAADAQMANKPSSPERRWTMSGGIEGDHSHTGQANPPELAQSPEALAIWPRSSERPEPAPLPQKDPQVAASHQLMWMAALAHMPVPDVLSKRMVTAAGPDRVRPSRRAAEGRWSLDAWTLWRQGSGGALVSQGRVPSYGASQAGAALAYRLAPNNRRDPRAYLRLYHALIDGGEGELAFGLSARPVPALPVRAYAEMRATRFDDDGTRLRPAVLAATEFVPQKLPAGMRGELYLQGGYVGGKGHTAFADGQLRVLRDVKQFDLAHISVGGAAWGGVQKGAHRLDLGPTLQADLTVGKTPARLSVDWRERVAGNADPESGVAVTLSTRF